MFCVWLYSAVKTEEKRDKSGKKSEVPIFVCDLRVSREDAIADL